MRKILQAAVAVLTLAAVPALAQTVSQDNKPQPSPILQDGIACPLAAPDPVPAYGIQYGPCSPRMRCADGTTITCSGQNRCTWKLDPGGFVECDGRYTYCPLA